mmetsp:Transcript_9085/g.26970  ORF Transcript_9085/g.26970 Transcript_9085/m.26970 type:complete len:499 (+) Transcript_9085:779-2275(+)
MVRTVFEIESNQRVAQIALDTADGPSVLESVRKEDLGDVVGNQVVEPEPIHQFVRPGSNPKACQAVFLEPFRCPIASRKHGVLRESNGLDQQRAGLKVPGFGIGSGPVAAPIPPRDGGIGSRGQLPGHVPTPRGRRGGRRRSGGAGIVAAVESSKRSGSEVQPLRQKCPDLLGWREILRGEDFAGLEEPGVLSRWIIRHVVVGKGVSDDHHEFVDHFCSEPVAVPVFVFAFREDVVRNASLANPNAPGHRFEFRETLCVTNRAPNPQQTPLDPRRTPRQRVFRDLCDVVVVGRNVGFLGIKLHGCASGVGHVHNVGKQDAGKCRKESRIAPPDRNDGAVGGRILPGPRTAQVLADVFQKRHGVVQSLFGGKEFHARVFSAVVDPRWVGMGGGSGKRLGFSVESMFRLEDVSSKGFCQVVSDKRIPDARRRGNAALASENQEYGMPRSPKMLSVTVVALRPEAIVVGDAEVVNLLRLEEFFGDRNSGVDAYPRHYHHDR